MSFLLALVVLAVGPPATVRSLRIEAPERFASYVDLKPGQPLDPEAVRRAVELLHATGEFEDVVVEVQETPEGVDVVVRTRPAPFLARIRLRGDRVVSAGGLRKRTRLRPREPLWPARLERAAREAALALAAQGYLEATVTALAERVEAGADAVFTVHAGPRVRVTGLRVEGDDAGVLLDDLLRPAVGQPYRKEQAERAAENMRKRLVAAGRWRAAVEAREQYDPGSASATVTFAVSPGALTHLEFEGTPVPRSLHRAVEGLVREGGARGDALEAAGERIEEALRRRGHRDVVVRHRFVARPPGETLVYEVQGGPAALVASVRVLGTTEAVPVLETREAFPLEERTLEADVRSIARVHEDRGYAEARVESEVPESGGPLPVVFRVRPGPRILVRAASVEGAPAAAGAVTLRLRSGEPYRLRDLAADRNAVVAACRQKGYLQAEVTPELAFSEDHSEVEVRLRVEPGRSVSVGQVVVAGLERTEEAVVRREITLAEGQPLSPDLLLESQRKLSALGLFERVSLGELDPERTDRRDVVVSLREAPATTLGYGVGYAERESVRASVEASRRNLFGMDRTLTAFARGSLRGSRFLLSYKEPYLLGKKRELFVTAFWEEEDRVTFDFNRLGTQLQTAHTLRQGLSVIGRYVFQKTRVYRIEVPIEEVDRQFRNYTISGPSASVVYDTRDDPLEPHRGRFLGTDIQLSMAHLGGDGFVKGFVQAIDYQRLGAPVTLALTARLGLGRTLGDNEPLGLPFPERFFAGGDYGPRGFALDTAGPLEEGADGKLFPTGGNALVFGGAELRFDLGRRLSLGTFLDSGNVYSLVRDLDLGDLRYSVGLGLRYRTPLGPIRVDWGYKLNRRSDESASHFHFTIGNAY